MTRNEFVMKATERMNNDGLSITPNEIKFEERFCRCGTKFKPESKDGSYRIFKYGKRYWIWWRNWSTGAEGYFSSVDAEAMSPEAKKEYKQAFDLYSKELAKEREKRLEIALKQAPKFWSQGEDLHGKQHEYLKTKQVNSYGLRISSSGKLMIPAYTQDGDIQNIQKIYQVEDRFEKLFYPWPVSGLYYPVSAVAGKESDALLIAEGYATAASLRQATGLETWVAFSAGNLANIVKFARQKYSDRRIVICADYDKPNQTYLEGGGTGLAMARKAALTIGNCYLAVPPHSDEEKIDFNDLACKHDLKTVRKMIKSVLKGKPQNACAMPAGYMLIKDGDKAGLYVKKGGKNILLGKPLEVTALACNSENINWAKEAEFVDDMGVEHSVLISYADLLGKNWQTTLANNGWMGTITTLNEVQKYLANCKPSLTKQLVEQPGWHQGKCFVLPDVTFGQTDNRKYRVELKDAAKCFTTAGTLEAWQNLAKLCKGNDFMKFGLAVAFVGPLLPLLKMNNVGFMLEGPTTTGKTTLLCFAASVYGHPRLNIRTFRATDNGLEDHVYLHNNTFFGLDEIGQVKADTLGAIIYMLGNGEGKTRADKYGGAKKVKKWRVGILCTGEVGINAILEECGKKILGGQEVRMSGFVLKKTHIKNLHSFDSSGKLVNFIKCGCEENYGWAGRDFLEKLLNHDDLSTLSSDLLASVDKIATKLCPPDADGQIRRVAKNMALVGCAGKLAAKFGTLPQTFAKLGYLRTCFNNWLENRKGDAAYAEASIVQEISDTLESNSAKHFQDIKNPESFDGELWGYKGVNQSGCQETDYLMTSETFKRLFCKGNNLNQIATMLKQRGMLRFDIDADGTERNTKKVTFGDFKQARLMVINLSGK